MSNYPAGVTDKDFDDMYIDTPEPDLCIDCSNGYHEENFELKPCDCPCHGKDKNDL